MVGNSELMATAARRWPVKIDRHDPDALPNFSRQGYLRIPGFGS